MSAKKDPSNKMVRTYVWVDPKLKRLLEAEAENQPAPFNSVSHLIRKLLSEHYEAKYRR